MPSYLYSCPVHGEFENFHSIANKLEACPQCRAEGIESEPPTRLIASGSSFILGSGGVGWYREGYSGK